ncbi:MAG: hypothetical protein WCD37_07985 [Chloroflexia bacterium]
MTAFDDNREPVAVDLPLPQGVADGRSFDIAWGKSVAGGGDYTARQRKLPGLRILAREGVVLLGGPQGA